MQYRRFSILRKLLKQQPYGSGDIKPVFKPHYSNDKKITFEKNLPFQSKPKKIWEIQGISKDEFFKRKYGNISAEERQKLNEKVERQRRYRQMRIDHEKSIREKEFKERQELRDRIRKEKFDKLGTKEESSHNYTADPLFEYVYGTHSVKSVLLAKKRPILNLYTHNLEDSSIKKFAEDEYGVRIRKVENKNALNVLCNNGVHNGVVLKTKKLPISYIKELSQVKNNEYQVKVESAISNEEEEILKKVVRDNNKNTELYPIAIYLDGVTDPQNMGSILRSAFFFGVDFIVVPDNSSARLGPAANKASVGSLDLIDIYKTHNSVKLFDQIKSNGWHVISAAGKLTNNNNDQHETESKSQRVDRHLQNKFIELSDLKIILKQSPVMLVLGSEGKGVSNSLKVKSDYLISIPKYRRDDTIVDSLNVGVATGIIIQNCVEQ
ncbi:unnamed protein product [Candida verbasci]|uniref:rRNA methyltransferase 1, mitochondrial n=1 Tax=Candida verbasci TaxID=1227364 RepID=A0A9W4TSA7_9ASCO|nr:unnamed protein product [Candida verbasci]